MCNTKEKVMIRSSINLSEKYPNVKFTSYIHDESDEQRAAVIVCPGGGYAMVCSSYEGVEIADLYYNAGFNAFMLEYTVAPDIKNLDPTIQVALAVKYVREHANELHVHPEKIVTCGFSAGGHLAGSAGLLWNIPEVREAMGDAPLGINRPNGMILCYPVITAGEHAHRGSFVNLTCNPEYGDAEIQKLSLEKNVDEAAPPIFIWHTYNDGCVPVQNSLLLMNAYLEKKRPFEAHIYPKGPHGMGLATAKSHPDWKEAVDPHVATWADLSVMWIKDTFC